MLPAHVISVDTPSGLDTTTAVAYDACVKATLTFASPKVGPFSEQARAYDGEVFLAGISIPSEVDSHMGLS